MNHVYVQKEGEIATVRIERGKVNALNGEVIRELRGAFSELEKDGGVRAVILTGTGKFFSFGFDVPEFLGYSPDSFLSYVKGFSDFCLYLFLYPKPILAAINGHATAGGCMLVTSFDSRIMVGGNAKIALNEIGFGSTVFASTVEMLKYWTGSKNAEEFLLSGRMYTASEALGIGLVDEVVTEEGLMPKAFEIAREYAQREPAAFASIKKLLRKPASDQILRGDGDSMKEFIALWYTPEMRERLKSIVIR